ncbi:NIPSNAP family protein [Sphingosinicella sp. CPCC 101087]|uniref:NIPSNAP family protein n=1 Tax=Sphingosinicella sp. CPCC 101087 TaxID=2497754 RepID=UPI00197DCD5C|nr:NIPSNAP family protein [Sphingosinicella sp. CPCC 101087]
MRSPPSRYRAILAALAVGITPLAVHAVDPPARPVQQLRVYQLFDATSGAFHDRFRDHARRIMARHGFDIVAMWETRTERGPEFVYLLNWPDEATMRRAWRAFLADDEWIRIKQESASEHGPMVGDIEERVLRPTDYSPALR